MCICSLHITEIFNVPSLAHIPCLRKSCWVAHTPIQLLQHNSRTARRNGWLEFNRGNHKNLFPIIAPCSFWHELPNTHGLVGENWGLLNHLPRIGCFSRPSGVSSNSFNFRPPSCKGLNFQDIAALFVTTKIQPKPHNGEFVNSNPECTELQKLWQHLQRPFEKVVEDLLSCFLHFPFLTGI